MKRAGQILWILLLSLCIAGCGIRSMSGQEEQELDYTVVKEENIPDEVRDILHIMVGYGLQNSGGYSIAVEGLTLAGEGICCETRLLGPDGGEELTTAVSYPYIVIKTEYRDAPVLFRES